MILVDSNLLVYARLSSFSQNARARAWLDERLNGSAPVGLPWPSLLGFIRVVTNRRIFERPLALEQQTRMAAHRGQVGKVAGVGERIQDEHRFIDGGTSGREPVDHEVRTDEAGPARHENHRDPL